MRRYRPLFIPFPWSKPRPKVLTMGELAAELGVTSMPTFLFFKGGEMVDTMRGANEEGLRTLVEAHI